VDRREFLSNSLAVAGGALLPRKKFGEGVSVPKQVPGEVAAGAVGSLVWTCRGCESSRRVRLMVRRRNLCRFRR